LNSEHLIFQADGTRYDLVLVDDPYGGVIVVWTSTGYMWRWYQGDYMKRLSKEVNKFDEHNIWQHLEGLD